MYDLLFVGLATLLLLITVAYTRGCDRLLGERHD